MNILCKLFNLPLVGKKLKNLLTKCTGGQQESKILRKYTLQKYNINVGMYSYGGCFSDNFNSGAAGCVIGKYCSFGEAVRYFGANHPTTSISTSPYFYSNNFGTLNRKINRGFLDIGNDVWCGYGVTILSGCHKIGNGAIIGARAVVTKDVPPYAIVVGVPAQIIKYRFSQETINLIEKTKWWDYSPKQLMKYKHFVTEPDNFCKSLLADTFANKIE